MIQPITTLTMYQRKEPFITNISKLVHTMSVLEVATEAQAIKQVPMGQVYTPSPATQVQGAIEVKM